MSTNNQNERESSIISSMDQLQMTVPEGFSEAILTKFKDRAQIKELWSRSLLLTYVASLLFFIAFQVMDLLTRNELAHQSKNTVEREIILLETFMLLDSNTDHVYQLK